jgi:Ca2+-binding EF-hand superfamily protein
LTGPRVFTGLRREFRRLDTDNSGDLDLHEFTAAILNLRLEITEEDILRLFAVFDKNKDGRIQE